VSVSAFVFFIVNSFSRFLIGYFKRSIKGPLIKKLTVWQLKVELESLHKLKLYPSVLLLMIKMSQSAREKLDTLQQNNWRIINTMASIWRENMLGYLSADIICSLKLTVFLELRSRETVHFSEQIMSADKYQGKISRQMEATVHVLKLSTLWYLKNENWLALSSGNVIASVKRNNVLPYLDFISARKFAL